MLHCLASGAWIPTLTNYKLPALMHASSNIPAFHTVEIGSNHTRWYLSALLNKPSMPLCLILIRSLKICLAFASRDLISAETLSIDIKQILDGFGLQFLQLYLLWQDGILGHKDFGYYCCHPWEVTEFCYQFLWLIGIDVQHYKFLSIIPHYFGVWKQSFFSLSFVWLFSWTYLRVIINVFDHCCLWRSFDEYCSPWR